MSHMWLSNTCNVTSATEELYVFIYLILIIPNGNLHSHMWLMVTILDSTGLEFKGKNNEKIVYQK